MRASAAVCLLLVAFTGLPVTTAQPEGGVVLPERFTAIAVSTGGPRTSSVASRVQLTINRWSTENETSRLMNVLKEVGPEAMLAVLRELEPVGTIQVPGNLSYDLHFADQAAGEDGGRRIVLATDRPISYWEAINQPRTMNYPFSFIELRVNAQGEGEGKLAIATRVSLSTDGETLEMENYAAQPIQLNQVRHQ